MSNKYEDKVKQNFEEFATSLGKLHAFNRKTKIQSNEDDDKQYVLILENLALKIIASADKEKDVLALETFKKLICDYCEDVLRTKGVYGDFVDSFIAGLKSTDSELFDSENSPVKSSYDWIYEQQTLEEKKDQLLERFPLKEKSFFSCW
jgi:hypothetical protein